MAGRSGVAGKGGVVSSDGAASLEAAIGAWRTPRALVAEGRAMASVAHAAIDISDGLACDVGHMAEASVVCAVLDEGALLADAELERAASALGASALDLALHGGEDYALVVASPVAVDGFRRIGEVTQGRGVSLRGANGQRPIEPGGFDHFTSGRPREASGS